MLLYILHVITRDRHYDKTFSTSENFLFLRKKLYRKKEKRKKQEKKKHKKD